MTSCDASRDRSQVAISAGRVVKTINSCNSVGRFPSRKLKIFLCKPQIFPLEVPCFRGKALQPKIDYGQKISSETECSVHETGHARRDACCCRGLCPVTPHRAHQEALGLHQEERSAGQKGPDSNQ